MAVNERLSPVSYDIRPENTTSAIDYNSLGRYELMSIASYVTSASILFCIWIVGSVGNFLVMFLVAKNRQLQTPINMLLVCLSFADFLMAAFGSPLTFTSAAYGKWTFGEKACKFYAFGMALGGITSITTLMALAFQRFLMIARPFRAADIQKQHSAIYVTFIWLYSFALTFPPLVGWASYGPEAAYISCSVRWEANDLGTTSYIVFLFMMGFILPTTVITLSYCGIICTIKQEGGRQATSKAEFRVVLMVLVMVIFFMLAWTPYAVVSFLVAFFPAYRDQFHGFLGVLPALFAKSSTCYNPIIYVGLNTQFRSAWLKLLGYSEEREEEFGTTAFSNTAPVGENAANTELQGESNRELAVSNDHERS